MTTIECFKLVNVSGDERAHETLAARFATREQAEVAKVSGSYPDYLRQIYPEKIVIFDTAIEWDPSIDHASRASGLAKLTPEEKAALGLK